MYGGNSSYNNWKEREAAKAGPMVVLEVSIDDAVFQKINHWIQKAPGEVSGLGKIVKQGNLLRVIDACLIKQQNGAAETELDPASVAKAMYELRNTPGALNFWWHSHVNMGVFWSGTDIDTIREIGRHGFVLSTVLNKKREMLSSLYVKETEFIPEVFINQIPTSVQAYLDVDAVKNWDAEYDAKCTTRSYGGSNGLKSEYDWRRPDYGSTAMGVGAPVGGCADVGDPYEGKYDNEGYNKPANDDAPETVSGRTVSNGRDAQGFPTDPSDTTHHAELLNDPYLCEEIIEDWAEDMEQTPIHKDAQNILVLIVQGLKKLFDANPQEISKDVHDALKAEYIDRFNISRAEYRAHALSH